MEITRLENETVFGERYVEMVTGKVKITVRCFTLDQVDAVKGLFKQVYEAGKTKRQFVQPATETEPARTVEYDDHSWLEGFMKSEGVIPRFLSFCVRINEVGTGNEVAIGLMPLPLTMQVFEEAFALNEDFFRSLLAFVTKAEDFIKRLSGQPTTVGQTTEASQTAAEVDSDDLLQSGAPVGQRSPLLFSAPDSPSANLES